jgi:hypothetical protein
MTEKPRKRVQIRNTVEVNKIASNETKLKKSTKQYSQFMTELRKLLTDVSLGQYISLGLNNYDNYATFISYKRVLDIYNINCESMGLTPLNIELRPHVKLDNDNAISMIEKYYTDDICIKKIQLLHDLWMVPKDSDGKEKHKRYILFNKYRTLDKYIAPYKFKTDSPMDSTVKSNLLVCYLYVGHIIKIIHKLRTNDNTNVLNSIMINYSSLNKLIEKVITNYKIEPPEENEYKDILLAFEDITLLGYKPTNRELKPENLTYHVAKKYSSIIKEYDPSMQGILFVSYL